MGGGGGGGNDEPSGVTIKGKPGQTGVTFSGRASSLDRTTDKQLEAKATTASKTFGAMTAEQRRAKSISELEGRLEKSQLKIPGVTGAIATAVSRQNLRNQISALKGGGFGEYVRSDTGEYVTVGVSTKEGGGDADLFGRRGDISGTTVREEEELAQNGGDTPSPTAPTEQEAAAASQEALPEEETIMARGRKRTRGKRAGQGGTLLEGYGSLYRGGSSKGVSS